ncbi:peptidoglycan-binding domain-containing protein [Neolewinella antarctica]|uniref:SPOR domain-containing protein n=1 Tax=Neolewinella antarctica TaxID=442734 RepID=A0ABX0XDC8_9BACT|nr:peptidoglycan-binding domain-containing protein [Neolewinella antarctica]NJC27256.1 hypothetical protein [Neolewinella antarctica]
MTHALLPRTLAFLCLTFLTGQLFSQDAYTVRAGVFRDVRSADFAEIGNLGYLYNLEVSPNESEVYVGQFTDQAKAVAIADQLNELGFRNARVLNLPEGAGQTQTFIQFAFQAANKPTPWKKYEPIGSLHVQSLDGNLKILTGPYDNAAEAKANLAVVKKAGYGDAFIKQVSSLRAIPVEAFETGLKKPFISIPAGEPARTSGSASTNTPGDSQNTVTPTAAGTPTKLTGTAATLGEASPSTYTKVPTAPSPTSIAPATAPTPVVSTAQKTTSTLVASTTLPAAAAGAELPKLDGATKRHSVAELQETLKLKGYYTGAIDGLYGPGTTAAYTKAWNELPEIRKYRLLSSAAFAPADAQRNAVSQWPEVSVMLTIVEDLAAGNTNVERARLLAQQRAPLFAATEKLKDAPRNATTKWAETVWANLNDWATEDPLHAQIVTAYRVSYHQSQARLEQHYANKGLGNIEARDLAIAMMENLNGAQLDRFL